MKNDQKEVTADNFKTGCIVRITQISGQNGPVLQAGNSVIGALEQDIAVGNCVSLDVYSGVIVHKKIIHMFLSNEMLVIKTKENSIFHVNVEKENIFKKYC